MAEQIKAITPSSLFAIYIFILFLVSYFVYSSDIKGDGAITLIFMGSFISIFTIIGITCFFVQNIVKTKDKM